ncbi:hypothetical protein TNCV_4505011 [Trichonephila clavipes]|nr:hypothetical protein TNCV_4505011 [Trichonephila clavipes]
MASGSYMTPIYSRSQNDTESIEYNERVGQPSTSRNAENVALVSEDHYQTFKQIFEATHFSRESLRRKRPQFWLSDDWYLLHDKAPAHRCHLEKEFLAITRTDVFPQLSYSPDLASCNIYLTLE